MIISDSRNPVALPQQAFDLPDETKKVEKGSEAIDFDKMLSESNSIKQSEFEKEKNAVGNNGEFHIGETKDAKAFREQLEKITGKKQEKAKSKLDQNDYLTLLVTQLKYQDPGKPMENYEMASQMAQFNTVEQLVGINKTLTNLGKSQEESKADKLSQYLGKYVEVQGNNLKLNSDNNTSVARFSIPTTTSATSIEIKNSQGKAVRSITLGQMQAGSHEVNWDGKNTQGEKLPAGDYTFVVHASSEDGKEITAKSSFLAKVNGITDILSGGKLETTAGTIEPTKILSVRNYEPTQTEKTITNQIEQKAIEQKNALAKEKGEEHGIN